ncbi:MAG: GAF domain-containing protein [Candidatus Wallbacteria bacterium]
MTSDLFREPIENIKSPVAAADKMTIVNNQDFSFEQNDMGMRFIKIAVSLSKEKDLKTLMNLITNEAMQLTKATRGTLYLVDHEKQKLLFYVTDQHHFNEITIPLNPESIAGYVGVTGETLLISDVYELSPDLPYKFNKSFDQRTGFRTQSMLVVPLHSHKNEILGILQLINKEENEVIKPFSTHDQQVLQAVGSQAAVSIENALLYKEIENLFDSFVKYSATAIDERDPCTGGHSRRVAMYSVGLATALDIFTPGQLKEIKYASWLHDIGKIGVKEAVLNKANKLTDIQMSLIKYRFTLISERMEKDVYSQLLEMIELKADNDDYATIKNLKESISSFKKEIEDDYNFIAQINLPGFMTDDKIKRLEAINAKKYIDKNGQQIDYLNKDEYDNLMVIRGNLTNRERIEMESHVSKTFEILKQIPFTRELKNVPEIAGKHHEKLDGSGYPNNILAPNIPTQVRIITIADIYDALVSQDRPYKKALPQDVALKILREEAEVGKLDKSILDVFINKGIYKMSDELII